MPIYKANGKKDGLQKYNVRINYTADSGQSKQLTRVAYGKDNAVNLEMRLVDEIKNVGVMPTKKMTLQELYDEYIIVKQYELKETSLEKIRQAFKYYILPTFTNYRIDRITSRSIQEWKILMAKKNLSSYTKKSAFGCFRACINYAIKMEYLQKNSLTKAGGFREKNIIKRKMDFYTPEEFKAFIGIAKDISTTKEKTNGDLAEWDYYVFFNIAFYTGLRKGEIHALKWSDISGIYLSVTRAITQRFNNGAGVETTPKTPSSIRVIEMPVQLIAALEEQRKRQQFLHNFTDDFRICNNIRNSSIERRNILYSTSAKVKTIRIHDFRHSHASFLAHMNINIQEIARRLGHAKIEETWNTYSHLYPKDQEEAVKALNIYA